MKKLLFLVTMIAMFSAQSAKADEGMWTMYNLPYAVYEQMKAEGFDMPYDALYQGEGALKGCVVNFSGYCSGVVVSPDGLVFTNHHCGFESIRSHSTVEHDYMLNGFIAKSYEEELPNENMYVSFMIDQRDITDQLQAIASKNGIADSDWDSLIDSVQTAMNDSVKNIDKTYHLEIDAFYEGNKYYATTYQMFTDLRLVFAIPKSMGKFGGETDNWMWPRQTCDFSVFRIYADPETNGPAAYSEKNVPYHPKRYAQVSMQGYKEGDFAMTYDSKYAQSSNYWKNSIGMNKCIDSVGIVQLKQQHEARIRAYQDSTGFLKGQLDLDELGKLYKSRFEATRAMNYFFETFYRSNELVTRALKVNTMQVEIQGPADNSKKQYCVFKDNSEEWDAPLDKEVMAALLKNYRDNVPAEYVPDFYNIIDQKFKGDYSKYVEYVYKKSVLMKSGKKIYINKKGFEKDPGVDMGIDLMSEIALMYTSINEASEKISQQEKMLCAAKLRMEEDMPHYSDANFTMRLSYGQVGGYLLNGSPSGYYTTTTGKMQLCFLTNNDITGGNSGSPMFNGKGELIGLAFDGNWDSLSSDIFFDTKLARCIGVDIRYVLYMIDRWGNADRLMREINAK